REPSGGGASGVSAVPHRWVPRGRGARPGAWVAGTGEGRERCLSAAGRAAPDSPPARVANCGPLAAAPCGPRPRRRSRPSRRVGPCSLPPPPRRIVLLGCRHSLFSVFSLAAAGGADEGLHVVQVALQGRSPGCGQAVLGLRLAPLEELG